MSKREFTAQRYSMTGSVRSGCEQVHLVLFEGARFRLDALRYYSDWGDKSELRCSWEGTWTQEGQRLLLQSEHQTQADRAEDHEVGLKRHEAVRYRDERRFELAVVSEDELTCPFAPDELGGVFAGQPLRGEVEPHAELFKALRPQDRAGPPPKVAVDAVAKPAW